MGRVCTSLPLLDGTVLPTGGPACSHSICPEKQPCWGLRFVSEAPVRWDSYSDTTPKRPGPTAMTEPREDYRHSRAWNLIRGPVGVCFPQVFLKL